MTTSAQAPNWSERVALELMRRRRAGKKPGTITELAAAIGYTRPTVSRALNHDEFPEVRRAIAARLRLNASAVETN